MFQSFSVAPQYLRKINRKIFLGQKHEHGIYQIHEISYEKRLEIVVYKTNGKSYQEIATIVGCSKNAAFAVCIKFVKFNTVKNLPRVGRPVKIKIPRHERSLLRVLRCSRFELLQTLCWRAKKLTFETLVKQTQQERSLKNIDFKAA